MGGSTGELAGGERSLARYTRAELKELIKEAVREVLAEDRARVEVVPAVEPW